jgi:hypothetical protein
VPDRAFVDEEPCLSHLDRNDRTAGQTNFIQSGIDLLETVRSVGAVGVPVHEDEVEPNPVVGQRTQLLPHGPASRTRDAQDV